VIEVNELPELATSAPCVSRAMFQLPGDLPMPRKLDRRTHLVVVVDACVVPSLSHQVSRLATQNTRRAAADGFARGWSRALTSSGWMTFSGDCWSAMVLGVFRCGNAAAAIRGARDGRDTAVKAVRNFECRIAESRTGVRELRERDNGALPPLATLEGATLVIGSSRSVVGLWGSWPTRGDRVTSGRPLGYPLSSLFGAERQVPAVYPAGI
jgi:hypothetical protein